MCHNNQPKIIEVRSQSIKLTDTTSKINEKELAGGGLNQIQTVGE